jgi:hypothetical protein
MIYKILQRIEAVINTEPIAKTVTNGDLFEVDLNKKTLFPLSHIILNNATHQGNVISFNFSILFMDLEDIDDRTDVLNTQFMLATRVMEKLSRAESGIELIGNPVFEPFHERFENNLAGWAVTFDINVKNEMTVC